MPHMHRTTAGKALNTPPLMFFFSFCHSSVSLNCCTGERAARKARKSHALVKQGQSGETTDIFHLQASRKVLPELGGLAFKC